MIQESSRQHPHVRRPLKRKTKKRLGEILLELGIINPGQLEQALLIQKGKDTSIFSGEILVDLGFTSEEDVFKAFIKQYLFPYIPVDNYEVNPEAIMLVPANMAREYLMMPLDRIGNCLIVAMSNPLNNNAIDTIEMYSQCKVRPCVAPPSEIRMAIEQYYNGVGIG